MVSFLTALLQFIRLFSTDALEYHEEQIYRIRNTVVALMVMPILLMLIGLVCGEWWLVKSISLTFALILESVFLLILSIYRAVIGVEIGTMLVAARPGTTGAATPVIGATEYVRLVASIMASELTVGILILVLPLHNLITLSILLIPLVMILVSIWIWQGGEEWWPLFTKRIAIIGIVVIIVANIFPGWFMTLSTARGSLDTIMTDTTNTVLDSTATATWIDIVVLVSIVFLGIVIYHFISGNTRTALVVFCMYAIGGFIVWFIISNQTKQLRADIQKIPSFSGKTARERSASVNIINPASRYILTHNLDVENKEFVNIIVRSDGSKVVATPLMRLPKCLPSAQFWYDVLPRDHAVVLRVQSRDGKQKWEIDPGKYKAGTPLPIVLRGDLLVQIETRKEAVFQIRCIT